MTRRLGPVILTALLALASCGDETGDGDADISGQEPSTALDGRTFVATSITDLGEEHRLVEGSELRISFDEGNVGLNAGCNHMGGLYSIDNDLLVISGMSTTDMGCSQPLMDQDAWVGELFVDPVSFSVEGDELTLTSGDVVIQLVDREVVSPDRSLEGTTWTLDSLITGDAVSSVPGGVVATLRIKDGQLHVETGCTTLDVSVTVDGDTIRMGDQGSGSAASECGPAFDTVDEAIERVLSTDVTWSIEEKSLTLTRGDRGLGFRAE